MDKLIASAVATGCRKLNLSSPPVRPSIHHPWTIHLVEIPSSGHFSFIFSFSFFSSSLFIFIFLILGGGEEREKKGGSR